MKLSAELILFDQVLKRLVQFLPVQFIHLQEEAFHPLIVHLLLGALLEDGEEFHAGDGIEGEDGVLAG